MTAFVADFSEELRQLAVSGRMPSALLFEGGTAAQRSELLHCCAACAVCSGPIPPCGECADCKKLETGHPDVITVAPAEGKHTIPVEAVRTVREQAYIRPNEAENKIFLFPDAAAMGENAQNALLKILEEPPAHVRFALAAATRLELLPTVLSRCTVFPLAEAVPELSEQETGIALKIAAELAGGTEGGLLTAAAAMQKDRALQLQVLKLLRRILRDAFAGNGEKISGCEKAAAELAGIFSPAVLVGMSDACAEMSAHLEHNPNDALFLSLLCCKLWDARSINPSYFM